MDTTYQINDWSIFCVFYFNISYPLLLSIQKELITIAATVTHDINLQNS